MQEQSIGAMLAAARQSAGLSVADVSAATRIRESIIQRLEQDDYDQCGGTFYARGHVKAVAKAVGLDPEATVHLYDQQHGGAPRPVKATAVFQADRRIDLPDRRGFNWTMALGVALTAVVAFGMLRVLGGGDEGQVADVQKVRPSVPPNTPITERPRSPRGRGMVSVQIKANRASHVDVRDAVGRPLFSGMLLAGKTGTWQAPERVDVQFSDTGAVSVLVNGKKLERLSSYGTAARLSFKAPVPQRKKHAR